MFDPPALRRKYGSVFVTNLESGDVIPWKQLSIGDYLEYSALLESGVYARATIEDEIFQKCVLDDFIKDSLFALKAGTVSTVVQDIISNSGPESIEDLNTALNGFRGIANQAIHQTASFICQAFPAYKLEDVYAMDYGDFMLRLAQSESKLIQLGALQEPINFRNPSEESAEEEKPKEKPKAMDLYLKYLEQQGESQPVTTSVPKSDRTVITEVQSRSLASQMTGHEKEDENIQTSQMVEDGSLIYKDYLDQLSSGGKLKIKTPEERLVAARERAKANEEEFHRSNKQERLDEVALNRQYEDIFKKKAAAKKK